MSMTETWLKFIVKRKLDPQMCISTISDTIMTRITITLYTF